MAIQQRWLYCSRCHYWASGRAKLSTHVREHIYKTAVMPDTDAYELDQPILIQQLAIQTWAELSAPRSRRRNHLFMIPVRAAPAGGYSTVSDLLNFDIALRQHKLLSYEYTNIVLSGKVAFSDEMPSTPTDSLTNEWTSFLMEESNRNALPHKGGIPGINAQLDMYLDDGYTVVVLSNYDPCRAASCSQARELINYKQETHPTMQKLGVTLIDTGDKIKELNIWMYISLLPGYLKLIKWTSFQKSSKIVTYSLLLVLVTHFPFNFSFKDGFSVKEIADSFDNSSSLSDQRNVLLFLLSFGLACLLQTRRLGAMAKFCTVLLSVLVYRPQSKSCRHFCLQEPLLSDILTNSIGGFMGFCAFICGSLNPQSHLGAYKKK